MNYYRPKEISWLSFNERVLQQAANEKIPIYERIKFLGIYSNNMDEFYRVRVATLKRLTKLKDADKILGYEPVDVLKKINEIVREQNIKYEKIQEKLRIDLTKHNVFFVNEKTISNEQKKYLLKFFCTKLKDSLMPIIIKDKKHAPDLVDDNIYFALSLEIENKKKPVYAILQLPTNKFDRFFILPKENNIRNVIYLDDIVRLGLKNLFKFWNVKNIEAYTFKITKDAELDIEDDVSTSYVEQIDKSLKRRKKANPVRLMYDKSMPGPMIEKIKKLFRIGNMDTVLSGGRYHNTKDFLRFPNIFDEKATYTPIEPIRIKQIENQKSYFTTIQKNDVFLYYPYHPFSYFIDFLREAAIDPNVKSIKVTLYRLAKRSDVIAALVNAVYNGKDVTAVIELQARFDESENIYWSEVMNDAGVKVIYGVPGLKVHSKLVLVERIENDKKVNYAVIGTGNFNESTAKLYTDMAIMTANRKITNDVEKVFEFLRNNYKHFTYNHLLVSPYNFRKKLRWLIKNEIANAKKGKKAYIHIKLNNIDDREIINLLYEASSSGVEVVLLIRGMFSLVTGIKDVSDKIIARGIVDRFLEHSRFMIFANGGKPLYFISSADMMVRNIDRRVEVTMPVYDTNIQKILSKLFEIYKKDNVAARVLDKNLTNKMYKGGQKKIRSQIEVYNYLKELEENKK